MEVQPIAMLRDHQHQLVQRQRCPRCAERVPAQHILRGLDCTHCQSTLRLSDGSDHAREVLVAIRSGWNETRVLVYGCVLLATFLTGMVPMVAAVATTIAMTLANVLLIRGPLQWLPPMRRIWTWLRIDLWFLVLTIASLLLHALAATLLVAFGSGALLSAITGLAVTFMYIEGSLGLIASEVERISRGGTA